jgi:hypothetical protein
VLGKLAYHDLLQWHMMVSLRCCAHVTFWRKNKVTLKSNTFSAGVCNPYMLSTVLNYHRIGVSYSPFASKGNV